MSEHALSLERTFRASPANVWRCLTEAELIRQWFAPAPVTVPVAELDPVPGGTFHVVMDVPDHGRIDEGAGCVLLVEHEKRLVWTNAMRPGFVPRRFGDGPMEFPMTAEMTVGPDGNGGCRYVARALHASAADAANHERMGFHEGWGTAADQLGERAAAL